MLQLLSASCWDVVYINKERRNSLYGAVIFCTHREMCYSHNVESLFYPSPPASPSFLAPYIKKSWKKLKSTNMEMISINFFFSIHSVSQYLSESLFSLFVVFVNICHGNHFRELYLKFVNASLQNQDFHETICITQIFLMEKLPPINHRWLLF